MYLPSFRSRIDEMSILFVFAIAGSHTAIQCSFLVVVF